MTALSWSSYVCMHSKLLHGQILLVITEEFEAILLLCTQILNIPWDISLCNFFPFYFRVRFISCPALPRERFGLEPWAGVVTHPANLLSTAVPRKSSIYTTDSRSCGLCLIWPAAVVSLTYRLSELYIMRKIQPTYVAT